MVIAMVFDAVALMIMLPWCQMYLKTLEGMTSDQ